MNEQYGEREAEALREAQQHLREAQEHVRSIASLQAVDERLAKLSQLLDVVQA